MDAEERQGMGFMSRHFAIAAAIAIALVAWPCAPATLAQTGSCLGDCNSDGEVTIDEVLVGVSIAQGGLGLVQCAAFDGNSDGEVTVDEVVTAISFALCGCNQPCAGEPTPTATPTPSPEPPPTPFPTETPELPTIQLNARLLSRFRIELTWRATPPAGAFVFAVTLCAQDQDSCYPPFHYPLIPEGLRSRSIVIVADAEVPFDPLECFRVDILDRDNASLAFSNVACVTTSG